MSLPYQIVALDLDYTFLTDAHEIPPRNAAAVAMCRRLGVKVVITSGRMYCSTLRYVKALGLTDSPAITYNGAFIKLEDTGKVLLDEHLDVQTAQELVEFCANNGLNLNYYLNDKLYIEKINPWAELYSSRTGVELNPVGDLRQFSDQAPTKVLIVDAPERISQLYAELAPRYAERAYVTISNAEYLEFMPATVDKGKGLAVVAAYYGIPRERVIYFGDANNDIPAIRWAGLGVAMENATPQAKAAADRIAPPYDQDGVAQALEDIFACALPDA